MRLVDAAGRGGSQRRAGPHYFARFQFPSGFAKLISCSGTVDGVLGFGQGTPYRLGRILSYFMAKALIGRAAVRVLAPPVTCTLATTGSPIPWRMRLQSTNPTALRAPPNKAAASF